MAAPEDFQFHPALSKVTDQSDVMNDPAYHSQSKGKEKDADEVDTCRICRGEGSPQEPLFYPCKCSGSIKFVHQNCLMEWLAHSQKKHCELCKTPFRFTKLYHPQMPSTVPIPVFFRQAALHGWSSLQTWTRFQVVFFVWMFWLPWCMRTMWRGFFWIGDGAWIGWNGHKIHSNPNGFPRSAINPGDVRPLGKSEAATAYFAHLFEHGASQLMKSGTEPISMSLAKRFAQYFTGVSRTPDLTLTDSPNATTIGVIPRSSTWLSDVPVFNTMTRSTTLNNLIIDTVEGQLITLLVVVAFILIFLIREWVMQQQQNILLGPDGENNGAGEPNIDDLAQQQQREPEIVDQEGAEARPGINPRPRLLVRPMRRVNRPLPHDSSDGPEGQDRPIKEDIDLGQPNPPDAETPSTNISELVQQLLTSERDSNADRGSTDLPSALSRLLPDILRRIGEDPLLDFWALIENEVPDAQRGLLLQRLREIEFQKYPDRLTTLILPHLEVLDGERVTDENQIVGEKERDELVGNPEPELQIGTSSDLNDVSDRNAVVDPRDAASLESSKYREDQNYSFQDRAFTDPQALSNDADNILDVNSQGPLSSGAVIQSSPWTSSDIETEQRAPRHDLKKSSTEETLRNLGVEGDLIDEPELLRKLATEDTSRVEDESSHKRQASHDLEEDVTRDEGPRNPSSDRAQEQGYLEGIQDWLWGDLPTPPEPNERHIRDEEHVVDDIAEEEPFVPIAHGQHVLPHPEREAPQAQDPEELAAAAQARVNPNDAEGADEIEDLEGIMELIGMEGPLAGLLQNGMFCAVLVSLTIFFGVWVPYMSGKIFLILLASPFAVPLQLLRMASTGADTVVDIIIVLAGGSLYLIDSGINWYLKPLGWSIPALRPYLNNGVVARVSTAYAERAVERLLKFSLTTGEGFAHAFDIPTFSIVAHESLLHIKLLFWTVFNTMSDAGVSLIHPLLDCTDVVDGFRILSYSILIQSKALVSYGVETLLALATAISHVNLLKLNLSSSPRTIAPDLELAAWNATDRSLAIAAGYVFFALLGMFYLYSVGALHGMKKRDAVDGSLAQVLYQAGGVLKVILIISIEMIVFPLYCGLLLDIALLPLFGNVTLMSRMAFAAKSPWTSIFVHWFVGTLYMFHFALFVSMCRKIMRTGVLYFIRDPDDPTFHPVRDVLERSVASQLWKISFSAFVYGGLVLLCLGGVVWGIALAFEGVFPIHWSSDEPVLEFPVDLLVYNFLMPMAVKFLKPSAGLSRVYRWWFQKCARLLRLSSFLFNDHRPDEQGRHFRRTWKDVFHGAQGDIQSPVIGEDRKALWDDRGTRAIFFRDGRYVRAPGSDQVRIPKGATTFVEVDEDDHRLDGIKDGDDDPHGRKMNLFMKVYVPPLFGARIAAFVCLVWLFAAFTGVSVTLIPLILGRWILAQLTPNNLRINDIYAFSMGFFLLGSATWNIVNYRRIAKYAYERIVSHTTSLASAVQKAKAVSWDVSAFLYVYCAIGILIPCFLSLILELYLIIPLQTYFDGNTVTADSDIATSGYDSQTSRTSYPVIHIIQDWTLGVLYVKTITRFILNAETSRPARALRAIVAKGWLSPDVRLATRAFILPATVAMVFILTLPLPLGWVGHQTLSFTTSSRSKPQDQFFTTDSLATTLSPAKVYRYSYPAVLALGIVAAFLWLLGKLFQKWRRKIRDEVYLIGERLHNFGEGARAGAMSRVRVGKIAVGRAAAAGEGQRN